MTKNYKILGKYIKDISSETRDIETYIFVKDNISKYQMNIDITSKALKNKLIEVNTTLKFEDKGPNEKKSYYEIVYATVIKLDDNIKDKLLFINSSQYSFVLLSCHTMALYKTLPFVLSQATIVSL